MTQQNHNDDSLCVEDSGFLPLPSTKSPDTLLHLTSKPASLLPSGSIVFNTKDTNKIPSTNEIARFTEDGFYYKGEFIEDAGEVYRLLKEVLNIMKAQQSEVQ